MTNYDQYEVLIRIYKLDFIKMDSGFLLFEGNSCLFLGYGDKRTIEETSTIAEFHDIKEKEGWFKTKQEAIEKGPAYFNEYNKNNEEEIKKKREQLRLSSNKVEAPKSKWKFWI